MRGLGALVARFADGRHDTPAWAAAAERNGPKGIWSDWDTVLSTADGYGWIGEDRAMGLPGVGRGVDLVADVIASLTPESVKNLHDPVRPVLTLPRPPILTDPDPQWHGRSAWAAAAARSLQLHGNAFADKTRDVDRLGYPTSLPLIHADRVAWERSARAGYVGKVYSVTDPESGARRELEADEMWHPAVNVAPGSRMGVGLLHRYQDTLRLIAAVEQATYVVMRDGKPVGVLSMDADMDVDELRESKDAFIAGVRRDGIAALVKAQFDQVGWNAQDLALVPAREFNLRLASDMTGVTPYLLGVPSESRVYSNSESEWGNFVRVTVNRYLGPIQDATTKCVPRGQVVRYNTDDLTRPDAKTRWENHQIAVGMGAMTVDEVRQEERMGPMPGAATTEDEEGAP